MWSSTQIVAELRRHNEIMQELLGITREWLQPKTGEFGQDNSPVDVDDTVDIDELRQKLTDDQLDKLERGETVTVDEDGNEMDVDLVDRVDDDAQ